MAQAERVAKAGCQIVRVTVPTRRTPPSWLPLKRRWTSPLWRTSTLTTAPRLPRWMPVRTKFRINPGNIGDDDRVKAVADACNARNVPIRIGVNGGSLEKQSWPSTALRARGYGGERHIPCAAAAKYDFDNIVISIKSSNVPRMMAAYRLLASQTDYLARRRDRGRRQPHGASSSPVWASAVC